MKATLGERRGSSRDLQPVRYVGGDAFAVEPLQPDAPDDALRERLVDAEAQAGFELRL